MTILNHVSNASSISYDINSARELMYYRKALLSKPFIGTLFLDAEHNVVFSQDVAESPLMSFASYRYTVAKKQNGSVVNYDVAMELQKKIRFQDTFIKVVNLPKKKVASLVKAGFALTDDGHPSMLVMPQLNSCGKVSIWRCKELDLTFFMNNERDKAAFEQFCKKYNCKVYKAFCASASDVREGSLWFMNVTDGDKRDFVANELTGGAYKLHFKENMQYKKLVNMMARIGLWIAPAVKLNSVPGILHVMGKVKNFLPLDVDADGKPCKGETWDGAVRIRGSYLARSSEKNLREKGYDVTINPDSCIGKHIQMRTTVVNIKCSAVSSSDKTFNRLANNLLKNYVCEVIGDPSNIVMIADDNAVKIMGDKSRTPIMYLLDLFEASKGKGSVQLVEKFDRVDKDNLVKDFKELVTDKEYNELFGADSNGNLVELKSTVPTCEEIESPNMYVSNVLTKINRNMIYSDAALLKAASTPMIRRWERIMNKFNVPYESLNLKLWFEDTQLYLDEPAKVLSNVPGILKYGEAFNFGLWRVVSQKLKNAKDEVERTSANACIGIKYPAMGKNEVYVFTVVSPAEIRRRIATLDCSNGEKAALYEEFLQSDEATLVLPAYDCIKKQCAGSDIDGDGMTVFTDSRVKDYFFEHINEIVNIDTNRRISVVVNKNDGIWKTRAKAEGTLSASEGGTCTMDNLMGLAYLNQVVNKSIGVGPITRRNDLTMALYYAVKSNDMNAAKKVFAALGATEGGHKYVSPLKRIQTEQGILINVSVDDQKKIIDAIKGMDVNDEESLNLALEDLNVAHRMLQELTIDAAKKGMQVPYMFKALQNFKCKAFLWNGTNSTKFFSSLKTGKRVPFQFKRSRGQEDITYVDDVFSEVQDDMSVEIADKAEALGNAIEAAQLSKDELTYLQDIYNNYPVCKDINQIVKVAYRACAMSYSNSLNTEEYNEDAEDAENTDNDVMTDKDEARALFDAEIETLDNTVRWMLQNVDDIALCGDIIKAVSICGGDGVLDGTRTNQMPYNVFFEATLARVIAKEDSIRFCGYRINAAETYEGETLSFVNGLAKNAAGKAALLDNSHYSGELVVQKYNDELYAAKPIEIDRKPYDESHIGLRVRKAFNVKAILKTGKLDQKDTMSFKELERAFDAVQKIYLFPQYKFNNQLIKDCIVVDMVMRSGKIVTIPVGKYAVNTKEMETVYDGLICTRAASYVKKIDTEDNKQINMMLMDLNIIDRKATKKHNYK